MGNTKKRKKKKSSGIGIAIPAMIAGLVLVGGGSVFLLRDQIFPSSDDSSLAEKSATVTVSSSVTAPAVTSAPEQTVTSEIVTTAPAETVTEPVTTPEPEINIEDLAPESGQWVNGVVMYNRGTPDIRAMPVFYGTLSIGEMYADLLNKYKEMVGDKVNIYNMSIPLASAFYMPKNLQDDVTEQHGCITHIGDHLSNVKNIDAFEAIGRHGNEYVYSRTDHHWQPLGAYYAAQAFCKEAGVPFPDLSTYEKCHIDDFLGSMYMYTDYAEDLAAYPDTFWYYKPSNEYTTTYYNGSFQNGYDGDLFFDWAEGASCYSAILGGDMNIAEIKTDVDNDRVLVIIKDSYGNALVPFFVGSFSKIYVTDFRYVDVKMKDFFEEVGATDVLFGMSISSNYSYGPIESMEAIMQ